jgi:hypothetical protein
LNPADMHRDFIITQYKLNKYLNYKYDQFFTRRVENIKILDGLKKLAQTWAENFGTV